MQDKRHTVGKSVSRDKSVMSPARIMAAICLVSGSILNETICLSVGAWTETGAVNSAKGEDGLCSHVNLRNDGLVFDLH